MRAMILSAGYGTRLWPLTEDRTKPAIPILGKPLVGYVASYLARFGLTEVIVNLHHRSDSVRRALGDGREFGVHLEYIEEPVILGTSGALDNARTLLQDDTFVVVNGKIITDIDLARAIETHRRTRAIATLVLLVNEKYERFTVVETDQGLVKRFAGMPPLKGTSSTKAPLMFTGIQILEPRIFEYIPRGIFSHSTTDVYPQAIAAGEIVAAHVAEGKWYELSTIRRYLEISLEMLSERDEKVFQGASSQIDAGARVSEAILWDNVLVESGAEVSRAILADDVKIPSGEVIANAAVVRAALIEGVTPPPKALRGEVRGNNFVVPLTE